jgi:glycosyltransferase involved in cell wall biosynthesis
MNIKYSVIIPCYNIEKYVDCLLNFIKFITEKRDDVEFIMINDGSTDKTHEFLKGKENIVYKQQGNHGVSIARNRGVSLSTGEYILFLDADDSYHPSIFDELDFIIKDNDIIIFNYKINNKKANTFLEEGNYSSKNLLKKFLNKKSNFHLCATCYKKDYLKKQNILFKDNYPLGEDINYFIKAIYHSNKIFYIDKELLNYNLHEGSAVNSIVTKNKTRILELYNEIDFLFSSDKDLFNLWNYFKQRTFLYLIKKSLKYGVDKKSTLDYLYGKHCEVTKYKFNENKIIDKKNKLEMRFFLSISRHLLFIIKIRHLISRNIK